MASLRAGNASHRRERRTQQVALATEMTADKKKQEAVFEAEAPSAAMALIADISEAGMAISKQSIWQNIDMAMTRRAK